MRYRRISPEDAEVAIRLGVPVHWLSDEEVADGEKYFINDAARMSVRAMGTYLQDLVSWEHRYGVQFALYVIEE